MLRPLEVPSLEIQLDSAAERGANGAESFWRPARSREEDDGTALVAVVHFPSAPDVGEGTRSVKVKFAASSRSPIWAVTTGTPIPSAVVAAGTRCLAIVGSPPVVTEVSLDGEAVAMVPLNDGTLLIVHEVGAVSLRPGHGVVWTLIEDLVTGWKIKRDVLELNFLDRPSRVVRLADGIAP